ncbi:MAG: hypothetical protein K0S14_1421 [Thermomicrobiales bacterium]|jgi:hypothetical protein|nr:hypothetical protein [Thermomicrobiales bacterium]
MNSRDIEVQVTLRMSLAEALELESRLAGGAETPSTKAMSHALALQLDAASAAIDNNINRRAV